MVEVFAEGFGDASGRYEMREVIGAGGMGVVYRVYDRERGCDVALKTFKSPRPRELFLLKQEFRALSELRHPNVVELYELTVLEDGRCFYTMELVNGLDPRQYCGHAPEASGERPTLSAPLTTESEAGLTDSPEFARVEHVLRGLSKGVAAIHRAGMLHRDLKCSNVLVTPEGVVKILDFGLVMYREDGDSDAFAGQTVGTLAYMSPEQAGGRPLTPESDWYSVGVILFELLTGAVPFDGPPLRALVEKQRVEAPRVTTIWEEIPPVLDELCAALLAREHTERERGVQRLREAGFLEDASRSFGLDSSASVDEDLLVGREAELAALTADLAQAARRQIMVRAVEAASGMGKSTLVRTFLLRALRERPDLVVIQGRCREQERVAHRALDTLVDSLGTAWMSLKGADAHAILPRDVGCLLRLCPTLARVPAVAAAPVLPLPSEPALLYRGAIVALTEIFERLASRMPVVIFLDDYQWADPLTRQLVTSLHDSGEQTSIYVILARREQYASTPQSDVVEGDWPTLRLSKLAHEDLDLLAARLGLQVDKADLHVVGEESGGNPFFALTLLRRNPGGEAQGVRTLHDCLWASVLVHGPDVAQVVQATCLAVEPLPKPVLRQASGLSKTAFATAMRTALGARLVRRAASETDEAIYEPYHAQVGDAITKATNEEETFSMHRALADAWRGSEVKSLSSIAVHLKLSGAVEPAVEALEQAAQQAHDVLDFEAEARFLNMMRELRPKSVTLAMRHGEALAASGRLLDAAEQYEEVAAQGSDEVHQRALEAAATMRVTGGDLQAGETLYVELSRREGLRYPVRKSTLLATLLYQRLWILLWLRIRRSPRVVPRELQDVTLKKRVDSYLRSAFAHTHSNPMRAAALVFLGLRGAIRLGDPGRLARSLFIAAGFFSRTPETAHRMLCIGQDLMAFDPDPELRGLEHAVVAHYYYTARGEYGPAADRAHQSLQAFSKLTGVAYDRVVAACYEVWSLYYLGNMDRLRAAAIELRDYGASRGHVFAQRAALTGIVSFHRLARGETEALRNELMNPRIADVEPATLQDYQWTFGMVSLELFEGDVQGALARLDAIWRRMAGNLLLRFEVVVLPLAHLTLRADLVARRGGAVGLDEVERLRLLKLLDRSQHRLARPFYLLAKAGSASLEESDERALSLFEHAANEADAMSMSLFALAARHARCELAGDEAGRGKALSEMRSLGVTEPERIAHLMAPYVPR